MPNAVTGILKSTRKLLSNPDKWIKGSYAENGCYCLYGAIMITAISDEFFYRSRESGLSPKQEVQKTICEISPTGERCIEAFNDHFETTHEDVLNVLDKTIERLENEV